MSAPYQLRGKAQLRLTEEFLREVLYGLADDRIISQKIEVARGSLRVRPGAVAQLILL
jgi:hypothetical protein